MDFSGFSQTLFFEKKYEAITLENDFSSEAHESIFYKNLELLKVKYRKIIEEDLMLKSAEISENHQNCLNALINK